MGWENCTTNIAYPFSYCLDCCINTAHCVRGLEDFCCIDLSCIHEGFSCILDIVGLGCLADVFCCCLSSDACGNIVESAECLQCLVECWICSWLVSHCRCGCIMAQLQPELDCLWGSKGISTI